jgi:hypothetical protein
MPFLSVSSTHSHTPVTPCLPANQAAEMLCPATSFVIYFSPFDTHIRAFLTSLHAQLTILTHTPYTHHTCARTQNVFLQTKEQQLVQGFGYPAHSTVRSPRGSTQAAKPGVPPSTPVRSWSGTSKLPPAAQVGWSSVQRLLRLDKFGVG